MLGKIELEIAQWLALGFVPIAALVIGRVIWNLAENVAGGIGFKARGFREEEVVKLDGELAVIVSMGLTFTKFQMPNGTHMEYEVFVNSRLKFQRIRKLAPKLKHKGEVDENG